MNRCLTVAAALMTTASIASAGGIERAPQTIKILFEEGNYIEFSAVRMSPDVSGHDYAIYGGRPSGDVANGYNFGGLGLKYQINDKLSAALIVEQPFGADVVYPAQTAAGGSVTLGGTNVEVDSTTYTALLRYKLGNGLAVHGGLRGSYASGTVGLNGAAYGPVSGYGTELDGAWGTGYVLGASWEKPEIAARVSLTYNSPIEHEFDTTETLGPQPLSGGSTTKVKTPRSWTLEGQTGIAADTLLFGSIHWVNWSEFRVDPEVFTRLTGTGLVDLEDSTTYVIGVGRKFTDSWSGSMSFTYEKAGDKLVSLLAPTTGRKGVSLAAIYTRDKLKVTTGISYFRLGDADPETGTPAVGRARMRDGDALGMGVRVGYSF